MLYRMNLPTVGTLGPRPDRRWLGGAWWCLAVTAQLATLTEIAQSLSLSREAVKGRLHRARGLIREYLTGQRHTARLSHGDER
jgi:hypothetical protein